MVVCCFGERPRLLPYFFKAPDNSTAINNINIIPANIEPSFSTDENNNFPIKAAIMKIIIIPIKEPRQLR